MNPDNMVTEALASSNRAAGKKERMRTGLIIEHTRKS